MSGILQHKDVPAGHIHSMVNWEFDTLIELNAFTNVVYKDLRKVAYVRDTGSGGAGYYILDAINVSSGARTWVSIFGGSGSGSGANLSIGLINLNIVRIDSDTGTDATIPSATASSAGVASAAHITKLDSVASGATANDTDANLKARANHTGTQISSTISDLTETVQDILAATLVAGANVTLTYDDTANTLTVSSMGGTGTTNITASYAPTTFTVISDTGADAIISAADNTNAGAMTSAMQVKLAGIATGATANSADATLLARANHTGTQLSSTISDLTETTQDIVGALLVAGTGITLNYNDATNTLTITYSGGSGVTNLSVANVTSTTLDINSDTGTDVTLPASTGANAGLMTAAQNTKLAGIATGATANSSDVTLLARANHTGTQLSSTISDFTEAAQDAVAAALVAGTNIAITYNDAANTITVDASSAGGITAADAVIYALIFG